MISLTLQTSYMKLISLMNQRLEVENVPFIFPSAVSNDFFPILKKKISSFQF